MSRLKSAWEIALEKTKDIEGDPQKIREDELFNQGRRLAGTFLNELEDSGSKIVKQLKNAKEEERDFILNGINATILSNLALPQNTLYNLRLFMLGFLGYVIVGEVGESVALLVQIAQVFERFIQSRDTLIERARAQYQPIFEEKREQLRQKYGNGIGISMDQDPEFIQFLQRNFNQLSDQYQQVLDQAKEQLKSAWNYTQ